MASKVLPRSAYHTYDIRGIGKELIPGSRALGRAYGRRLGGPDGVCVVGRDLRPTSSAIARQVIAGLRDVGCEVRDIGQAATPLTYYEAVKVHKEGKIQGFNAGFIQVTGSHLPPKFNGAKIGNPNRGFVTYFGGEIHVDLRAAVEREAQGLPILGKRQRGKYKRIYDASFRYQEELVSTFERELRGFDQKVVLDPVNGTATLLLGVFQRLGIDIKVINDAPKAYPNHEADPTTPQNMEQLKRFLLSSKADLGAGFDGDSDRLGVLTEQGELIVGDKLIAAFAKEKGDLRGAKIPCEVKCGLGLLKTIESLNGIPVIWKTGHSNIKAFMAEHGSPFAGEMSGHLFFADEWHGFDDAVYASLRLTRSLKRANVKLGEFLADYPKTFISPEFRPDVDTPNKLPHATNQKIVKELVTIAQAKGLDFSDVDGVRLDMGENGWGLVRSSNTQPSLSIRVEGYSKASQKEVFNTLKGLLEEAMINAKTPIENRNYILSKLTLEA